MKLQWPAILALVLLVSSCTKTVDESLSDEFLRFYGDAANDRAADLDVFPGGDYLITGYTTVLTRESVTDEFSTVKSSNRELCIIRTSPYGKQKWLAATGGIFGDSGNASLILPDGDIVTCGTYMDTTSTGTQVSDILIARFSSSGEELWSVHYGGKDNQAAMDLAATSDGGFIILGYTDAERTGGDEPNPRGTNDVYCLKLSASGDSLWSYAYGFSGRDYGMKIIPDGGNRYMILAQTENAATGQALTNMLLFRINESGNNLGFNTIGTIDDEYPLDMQKLEDGYLISGYALVDGEAHGMVVKIPLDTYQTPLFYNKSIQIRANTTYLSSIAVIDENTYAATGYFGNVGEEEIFLQYLDQNGNSLAEAEAFGGSGSQYGIDICVLQADHLLIAGHSTIGLNSLISLLKVRNHLTP